VVGERLTHQKDAPKVEGKHTSPREESKGEASVYCQQSQIAERKTVGEQGPGDRGKKNQ